MLFNFSYFINILSTAQNKIYWVSIRKTNIYFRYDNMLILLQFLSKLSHM